MQKPRLDLIDKLELPRVAKDFIKLACKLGSGRTDLSEREKLLFKLSCGMDYEPEISKVGEFLTEQLINNSELLMKMGLKHHKKVIKQANLSLEAIGSKAVSLPFGITSNVAKQIFGSAGKILLYLLIGLPIAIPAFLAYFVGKQLGSFHKSQDTKEDDYIKARLEEAEAERLKNLLRETRKSKKNEKYGI